LAAAALVAGAFGLWLHGQASLATGGYASGALAGLLCGATAVGGAALAHARGLQGWQTLALLLVGMVRRMVVLGTWAVVSLKALGLDAMGFAAGFAAVYGAAVAIEIWMVSRLGRA